jgi:hypothetical protein
MNTKLEASFPFRRLTAPLNVMPPPRLIVRTPPVPTV